MHRVAEGVVGLSVVRRQVHAVTVVQTGLPVPHRVRRIVDDRGHAIGDRVGPGACSELLPTKVATVDARPEPVLGDSGDQHVFVRFGREARHVAAFGRDAGQVCADVDPTPRRDGRVGDDAAAARARPPVVCVPLPPAALPAAAAAVSAGIGGVVGTGGDETCSPTRGPASKAITVPRARARSIVLAIPRVFGRVHVRRWGRGSLLVTLARVSGRRRRAQQRFET